MLSLTPQVAEEKLLSGEIDAALMLLSWDSPVVKRLLADDRIELASFRHADAYVALLPYLSKVTLPAGVADLARHRPATDTTLVAARASLIVQKDLSTAIQYLLLNTAVQIHSGPGIFQQAGQFPAAEAIDIPLSDEALQFYKSGRPFLNNFMPFWMAALVGRLLVVLIPLIGVLYPLMRFMPAVYDWGMRRKITRIYGELRFLEAEMETRGAQFDPVEAAERLDQLERQANQLKMPIAYASMLYLLRNHIALVRDRLKAAVPPPARLPQANASPAQPLRARMQKRPRRARAQAERKVRRAALSRHHHLGADRDAPVEVEDVAVVHADAAVRHGAADRAGLIGAVDGVFAAPLSVIAATPIGFERLPPGMTFGRCGLSRRTSAGGDHAGLRYLPLT